MNTIFSTLNFFIFIVLLILGFVGHLMYGHSQSSKYHFIIQQYYMLEYLPDWMVDDSKYYQGYLSEENNHTGKWYGWYKNGNKECEVEIINGKKNGKWLGWYESGAICNEVTYKDGTLTGKLISWYESGAKRSEVEYKDDMKNGKEIIWYLSGSNFTEREYKDGKLNNRLVEWDKKGNIIKNQDWKDGVLVQDHLTP